MISRTFRLVFILLVLIPILPLRGQGTWTPAGSDLRFPRTIIDSSDIGTVRSALSGAEPLWLYGIIWNSANSAVPAGNSTEQDRVTRSVIAKEAAFCYLMDRKISSGQLVPLTAGGRDSLKIKVTGLLEQINTTVEVGGYLTFYTPWQSRSKELIACLIAYDLLKGAGVAQSDLDASKARLLTFTANLYQKAMATYTILSLKFFTYQFNNHSIMTASALGLAAVVFNDQGNPNVNYQPQNWINAGLYNIDNTLWVENGTYPRVSEPDTLAGYAEGPNYFKYCFENAFPFIRAMGNFLPDGYYSATFNSTTRSIRNLWYDTRYDRLYDWLNKIRMPDGGFPSIHDCYMGYGTVIMALSGKPQFNAVNPYFNADDASFRTQYIAANVAHGPVTDSLFQSLPAAGSLVFRSSWDPAGIYMHFIGKHGIALSGAKSHHQADASSFSLMAHGQLLAVDPGYPGAALADLENKAIDHSLVLVNGSGPLTPTGEYVSTSTNTAYIEHVIDTPILDYGEVRVTYQGADIVRKNLFIRNTYFVLSDFVTSSSSKNYTWQLHGNGLYGASASVATGAFVPDFAHARGFYQRDTVTLLARVTAPGGISGCSYELDSMVTNGGFRRYSKMLVLKNSVSSTIFLSALYPYTTGTPVVTTSGQSVSMASLRVTSPGYRDLVFNTQAGTLAVIPSDSTGMSKPVKGNGRINFYSEDTVGQFSAAFLHYGDSLVAGNQVVIRTGKKMDVAWTQPDGDVLAGYVSDSGLVRFRSDTALQMLTGPAVSSVSYNPATHLTAVSFVGKGNFLMGGAGLTWVWSGQEGTDWHNPTNWHLMNHPAVKGVPVASNNVVIPSDAVNMPLITSSNPAVCHNLEVQSGASLTIQSMKFLTVEGTLTIGGDSY